MVLLYPLWTITASLVFCSLFDHCSAWPNQDNEPLNDPDSLPPPPREALDLAKKHPMSPTLTVNKQVLDSTPQRTR